MTARTEEPVDAPSGAVRRGTDASRPVRTTASHTTSIPALAELLLSVPTSATAPEYTAAIVEDNVLGRPSVAGRVRIARHLRELYVLDPLHRGFAALRHLHRIEPAALPLMAGQLAVDRDELLRASWGAVAATTPGAHLRAADVVAAARSTAGPRVSEATLAKIARNTTASWTQTGHLTGRTTKVRSLVVPGPAAAAFAVLLGHLGGARGDGLLTAPAALLLDAPPERVLELYREAGRAGLVDVRIAGRVVDIDPAPLLAAAAEGRTR